MITKTEASSLKNNSRNPVWFGEDFAVAVVRIDKEIRRAASCGVDGTSMCFNPDHVVPLLSILRYQGFDQSGINQQDKLRIDISW